jgi:hypothetical protein
MADHTQTVADVKANLIARGVSLAGACGAFEITKRVAWILRNDGWGFLVAPVGGENCNGFRTDKLVTQAGLFVDLLVDAGNTNGPAWQERGATPPEIAAWRAPMPVDDPATPAPAPDPTPPAVPASDLLAFAQELFSELEAIHNGLADLASAVVTLSGRVDTLSKNGVKVHL